MRRHLEALHMLTAILWFTALVGAGLGAAVVFPALKPLNPQLPDFAAYTGEHWRIAAGHVGNRLFAISDAFQLACPIVCTLLLVPAVLGSRADGDGSRAKLGVLGIARLLLLAIAVVLGLYQSLILGPHMRETIEAFWAAARAGNMEAAAPLQSAFDADHPKARFVMESSALAVLGVIVTGLWKRADCGLQTADSTTKTVNSEQED
jgi:hypothetical protein